MFILSGMIAISFSAITIVLDGYDRWLLILALGGVFLFGIGYFTTKLGMEEIKKRPVVVSTKVPPQIDTTITITNGVADTVYTYHLIKK